MPLMPNATGRGKIRHQKARVQVLLVKSNFKYYSFFSYTKQSKAGSKRLLNTNKSPLGPQKCAYLECVVKILGMAHKKAAPGKASFQATQGFSACTSLIPTRPVSLLIAIRAINSKGK